MGAVAPTRADKRQDGTQQEKPELASSCRAPWGELGWLPYNGLRSHLLILHINFFHYHLL